MSLASITNDGYFFALNDRQIGIVVIKQFCHSDVSLIYEVVCDVKTSGGYATRTERSPARSVIDRAPRPIATEPDFTISRISNGSRAAKNASSFSGSPVASMVTASGTTSTT